MPTDFIPVYQPSLQGNEKRYVMDCLDSTWISSKGKYLGLFEEAIAQFVGVEFASAVSNGTVALHAALLALGIGEGDEVIVPALTYIASANAIAYTGATPFLQTHWPILGNSIQQMSNVKSRHEPRQSCWYISMDILATWMPSQPWRQTTISF